MIRLVGGSRDGELIQFEVPPNCERCVRVFKQVPIEFEDKDGLPKSPVIEEYWSSGMDFDKEGIELFKKRIEF